MARDENGTYTLPEGDVVSGTPITTEWGNNSLNDLKAAMTDSLSRSGKGGMQEQMKAVTGTPAEPGYSFNGNLGTGRSLDANGYIVESIGGVAVTRFSIAGGIEQYIDGAWEAVSKQDAIDVVYDPASSNLSATNVQAAIDEISGDTGGFVTLDTAQQISGKKTFLATPAMSRVDDPSNGARIIERTGSHTIVGHDSYATIIRGNSQNGITHEWNGGSGTSLNSTNAMSHLDESIIDLIYPVGIIVEFEASTDPGTTWPHTTWAPSGVGRWRASVGVHIDITGEGADGIPPGDLVEGTYYHKLTINEMPAHKHDLTQWGRIGAAGSDIDVHSRTARGGTTPTLQNTGGGAAHNNMPPAFSLYAWERTA